MERSEKYGLIKELVLEVLKNDTNEIDALTPIQFFNKIKPKLAKLNMECSKDSVRQALKRLKEEYPDNIKVTKNGNYYWTTETDEQMKAISLKKINIEKKFKIINEILTLLIVGIFYWLMVVELVIKTIPKSMWVGNSKLLFLLIFLIVGLGILLRFVYRIIIIEILYRKEKLKSSSNQFKPKRRSLAFIFFY